MTVQTCSPLAVTDADFQRDVAHYQKLAQSRPIVVTHQDQACAVLISKQEYDRLTHGGRQVMTLDDFSDDDIDAVAATRAPDHARAFDDELT